MKSLNNTETGKNLLRAFAGESQARNRYTFFSEVAEQEGYIQISEAFKKTADNEKEHAKRFYDLLVVGYNNEIPTAVEITAKYPIEMGTTLENLQQASNGEDKEANDVYPAFAKVAKEEGFEEVANVFLAISVAEKHHRDTFKQFASDVQLNKVFKKDSPVVWECSNCGYLHQSTDALQVCPSCDAKQEYFQVKGNN